jgi:hypothetical protein
MSCCMAWARGFIRSGLFEIYSQSQDWVLLRIHIAEGAQGEVNGGRSFELRGHQEQRERAY